MKQNLTISMDKELIAKLRVLAARRSSSISRLVGEELRRMVEEGERYDIAKRRALAALDEGFALGGNPASRGSLHER